MTTPEWQDLTHERLNPLLEHIADALVLEEFLTRVLVQKPDRVHVMRVHGEALVVGHAADIAHALAQAVREHVRTTKTRSAQ